MGYQIIDGIPVWGEPLENAVAQMKNCMRTAEKGALMADHHLGYAVPVGGVIAYRGKVSPSGVGFDIACGNKAILTDARLADVRKDLSKIMDDVFRSISFGVGRVNKEPIEHELFDAPEWEIPIAAKHKKMAEEQLGTVGAGNHYVDIFHDEQERIWIGVHFGSRGLGHRLATHFIKEGGGKDGIHVDPVVLDADSKLGKEYIACMKLAGRYAYAGRDWVAARVAKILGANILEEVHNHHNYAWLEKHGGVDLWVVRKGATPAFPGQRGFVGSTMGEDSVILEGVESKEGPLALYSTVHGAGRVMSRREAAGRWRWRRGRQEQASQGKVTQKMMREWLEKAGVELRGGGLDESPHAYKRLSEVLDAHKASIKIVHRLTPIGVAMAGPEVYDPFRD
ncbi:MAG TPA: RtcB family protein [Opitutales bacterium]|nr:RtcB family protein [Opitutales bacterium]